MLREFLDLAFDMTEKEVAWMLQFHGLSATGGAVVRARRLAVYLYQHSA